jgi:hypothetical protein
MALVLKNEACRKLFARLTETGSAPGECFGLLSVILYLNPFKHLSMKLCFKELRDRDFFNLCETIRKETGGSMSVSAIARIAVHRGAKSFYLSEREYARVYCRARRMPECKSEVKNEMYREIRYRFLKVKRECPGLCHAQIARLVGEQTAPRFYISEGSAVQLYYRLLRKRK